jgi:citrate lyase subunit beta/citryl-CoA lyase
MRPSPNRSFLFAPADHVRRAAKALASAADAAILDLEDAVAVSAKVEARAVARGLLDSAPRPGGARAFVRVNAFGTEWCFGDIAAVVGPGLDGIVLPKLGDAAELVAVDWALSALERGAGLPPGAVEVMPIVETALAHQRLPELARAAAALNGRVKRLAFGAADYALDLGLAWDRDEASVAPIRAAVAVASRAAGLEPPVDTVWVELADREGFRAACARGAAAGFQGKLLIHPDQIEGAHQAYSPSGDEVARARRVVAAFAEAEAQGVASIQVEGRFVDYPVVERARRVVALAERIGGG